MSSDGTPLPDAVTAAVSEETPLPPEVKDAVIKQVEFYFSDSNLPTDDFLMKHVRKSPHGWVNLHLIAKFKRMRTLSSSVPAIAAALGDSKQLVVSADGNAVRRKTPLPEMDTAEVAERTVIAEHLPRDKQSIEALTELFSKCGTVNIVRVCQPGQVKSPAQMEDGARQPAHNQIVSNQMHALVEYATPEEAALACKQLTEDSSWRAGLKVRPLVRGNGGKNKWGNYHDHQDTEHPHKEPEASKAQHASTLKDVPVKKVVAKHGSSTPDAVGSPVKSDAVAEALALARKATAIAASSSRRRSLESNGSAGNSRRGSMDLASIDSVKAAKAALRPRRSSLDQPRRSSLDQPRRSSLEQPRRSSLDTGDGHRKHSMDTKPSQAAVSAAAVTDAFASSAPRAEPSSDHYSKLIAKQLADTTSGAMSSATSGENTSSGGEDGEDRKSRRARRKDYATWASGVTAAAHKPGGKDHHGIYQPVMPDGSRGFSHGRGKPMPPPPAR
eukprot:jgi/Tetstr1/462102/TSEL_007170.t1